MRPGGQEASAQLRRNRSEAEVARSRRCLAADRQADCLIMFEVISPPALGDANADWGGN
jgi:hypothetical protein